MTWKPYAALALELAALSLAFAAGNNFGVLNSPDGPGVLSLAGAGVAAMLAAAAGCVLVAAVLGNAPASAAHSAAVVKAIAAEVAQFILIGQLEKAQESLDVAKQHAGKVEEPAKP